MIAHTHSYESEAASEPWRRHQAMWQQVAKRPDFFSSCPSHTERVPQRRGGNRRNILHLSAAVHAQPAPDGQRLPVIVNGKRVKTIDVHAHCLFHEAEKLMGDDNAAFRSPVKSAQQAFITLDERLRAMDAMAVDMEVLSINPFWYRKERDLAAEIVKIQNEKLAELCASQPDRFAAFASLTLQYPDLAVQQLE